MVISNLVISNALPVISAIGMSEIAKSEFDCGGGTVGRGGLPIRSNPTESWSCPDMSGLKGMWFWSWLPRLPDLGGWYDGFWWW